MRPLRKIFVALDGWQEDVDGWVLRVPLLVETFDMTSLRVTWMVGFIDAFGAWVLRWVYLRSATVKIIYSKASQEDTGETNDRSKMNLRDDVS